MRVKNKNNLLQKIIFSNFILIISLFLIIFFSTNLIRDFLNKKQLKNEVEKLQTEINELTKKNDQITNLISYLEGSDYLEEEARIKLNKKKPDEKIIIITENLSNLNTTTIINYQNLFNDNNTQESNLKRWWRYYFNEKDI